MSDKKYRYNIKQFEFAIAKENFLKRKIYR